MSGIPGILPPFSVSDRRIIIAAISEFLSSDAETESRRRKRLSDNTLAPWELRVGDHRVFYEIEEGASVTILAVGAKAHNELFIRGKKVTL